MPNAKSNRRHINVRRGITARRWGICRDAPRVRQTRHARAETIPHFRAIGDIIKMGRRAPCVPGAEPHRRPGRHRYHHAISRRAHHFPTPPAVAHTHPIVRIKNPPTGRIYFAGPHGAIKNPAGASRRDIFLERRSLCKKRGLEQFGIVCPAVRNVKDHHSVPQKAVDHQIFSDRNTAVSGRA